MTPIFTSLMLNILFHIVMWVAYRQEKKIATAFELRQFRFTWIVCGVWMYLSFYGQMLNLGIS